MIILLIMALLLIGLISVVAQSLIGLYSSANTLEQIHQEQRLERIWEDSIMQNLMPAGPNGEYIAPIGTELKNADGKVFGHGLPSFAEAPSQNSLGFPVRYCALGHEDIDASATGVSTIQLSESSSYQVETISVNGYAYVYRGTGIQSLTRNSPNVVAFIISPQSNYPDISCQGIQYDSVTGRYSLSGYDASVIPVLAPHVFTQ